MCIFMCIFTRYIGHDKSDKILIGVKNPDPYEDYVFIYPLQGDFRLIGVGDFDPCETGIGILHVKSGH